MIDKHTASVLMSEMQKPVRDKAIDEADNVIDLRSRFNHVRRQRAIAESYRKPKKPEGRA